MATAMIMASTVAINMALALDITETDAAMESILVSTVTIAMAAM